nr:zinc finger, CCHC-type, retrotransposon Gag domain protein [Tanacetum cinerariifolium]
MQRFLLLAGFLRGAAGTEEEQAKNFQWGLRRSTLNHLMCMSYTDVAQVANAARNYEILHDRDDEDTERPDKRQRSEQHVTIDCRSYQVANAARNYEILRERDDDDAERPVKRQKSGDRHQPTSQQSGHRNHGHNNDRHGSDRRCSSDNHRSSNNNYSGNNNRNSGNGRDQRNRGQQSNRSANSGSQQSRDPSEGYSYPVCTTCGRRHP